MKNPLLLLSFSLVVFFATSCIDNDESEGVKQIRLGQAALLQAQAEAATTLANSEAALNAAAAAYQQAQADVQTAQAKATEEGTRHEAAINALKEELRAAQTEASKADIQQQIERAEAQHEVEMMQLEVSKIHAENELLELQEAYENSQREYEEAKAQAEINHNLAMEKIAASEKSAEVTVLVEGYRSAYDAWSEQFDFINGSEGLKSQILQEQQALGMAQNNAKLFVDGYLKNQVDYATESVADLTSYLANADLSFDDLRAVYETEKTSLEPEISTLENDLDTKLATRAQARLTLADKWSVYSAALEDYSQLSEEIQTAEEDTTDAYNAYYTDKTWERKVMNEPVLDGSSNPIYVTLSEAVDAEKEDVDGDGNYLSRSDEAEVTLAGDAAKKAEDAYNAALEKYKALLTDWATAKKAKEDAETPYQDAREAYNTADEDCQMTEGELSHDQRRLSFINHILSNFEDHDAYVAELKDNLAQAKADEEAWTSIYNSAKDALEQGLSFNYYNSEEDGYEGWSFDSYLTQIEKLQTQLIAEEAKLDLYKAALDDWSAKLQAALEEEN